VTDGNISGYKTTDQSHCCSHRSQLKPVTQHSFVIVAFIDLFMLLTAVSRLTDNHEAVTQPLCCHILYQGGCARWGHDPNICMGEPQYTIGP